MNLSLVAALTENSLKAFALDKRLEAASAQFKGPSMAPTPKLNALHSGFADFTAKVEAAAEKMHKRMDQVGEYVVDSVEKFGKAVDQVEATGRSIEDAANQLSNGGPPLDDSGKSQG